MNLRFFLVGTNCWHFGGGFRPDALLSVHRGCRSLASHGLGGVPSARGIPCPAQGRLRRLFLPAASKRSARRRRHLLRRLDRGWIRRQPCLRQERRETLPACLCAHLRAPREAPLGRTRRRLHAVSARPLRGVQPGRGPRHPLRPSIRSKRRVRAGFAAAPRAVGLRLQATARTRPKPSLTDHFLASARLAGGCG